MTSLSVHNYTFEVYFKFFLLVVTKDYIALCLRVQTQRSRGTRGDPHGCAGI